jgi:hypothetical protein
VRESTTAVCGGVRRLEVDEGHGDQDERRTAWLDGWEHEERMYGNTGAPGGGGIRIIFPTMFQRS